MSLIVLCSFLALSSFGPNAVQLLAIKFSTITDTIFSFPAPALYSIAIAISAFAYIVSWSVSLFIYQRKVF
ncbi:hypothetical protein ACE41A_13955 [Bacillus cytotoxicus]|uniref:hypothetical protein n=1 Tax=Bacillus cytotoxicus TaxID=580165 RepID=UPI0035CB2C8D